MDTEFKEQEMLLQAMLLGFLLGDKSSRERVEADVFASGEFRNAAVELTQGGAMSSLQRVLEWCGVKWEKSDGSPLRAMVLRAVLDAKYSVLVRPLYERCMEERHNGKGKAEAVTHSERASERAGELQAIADRWMGEDGNGST